MDNVEKGPQLVDLVHSLAERAGQIEAEPVDVHLLHPISKAVHNQLQYVRVAHVQGVAAAGVIHVIAQIAVDKPIVRAVVDPRKDIMGPRWFPSAV